MDNFRENELIFYYVCPFKKILSLWKRECILP